MAGGVVANGVASRFDVSAREVPGHARLSDVDDGAAEGEIAIAAGDDQTATELAREVAFE
jgi:hypothetical protein